MSPAAERWRAAAQGWAIPPEILDAAPVNPWGCVVADFAERAAGAAAAPPDRAAEIALEALTASARPAPASAIASLLDVGCGGGAASVPLARSATNVTGVDQSPEMLVSFTAAVDQASGGVATVATVEGVWPDVAPEAPVADVVVVHDVLHNVIGLVPFLQALTAHARRAVVTVLPDRHPLAWLTPYWQLLHGLDRPPGPTADDAFAVLDELGLDVRGERIVQPTRWATQDHAQALATVRRRLCLTEERDPELEAALERVPPPTHRLAWVLQWPGTA